ncbi:MAG TPA: hypothetical protein VJ924_00250 [Alphaproteobacteria bacterium]|nr:hypothetical protein [Alphaproteobacteria bacterium]
MLGALDLKTLGRSPSVFPAELQPTLETLQFYLLRNRLMNSVGATFATVNSNICAHTVPQDEVWRVKFCALAFSRNVADIALTIEGQFVLRRATSASSGSIGHWTLPAVAATDLLNGRANYYENGLWLGPGDRVTIVVNTTITVGTAINLILDYDRMPSG